MSFHESPFDQGRWVGEDVQVGAYIFQFREEPYEFYRERLLRRLIWPSGSTQLTRLATSLPGTPTPGRLPVK